MTRLRTLAVAILAAGLGVFAVAGAHAAPAADTVKATFLSRFASFIAWPPGAFAAPDSPIVLCVDGPEGFRELVQQAAQGKVIGGRSIEVRSIEDSSGVRACRIIYASGDATDVDLHEAQNAPVLTITDAASRRGGRGIIHFVTVDNRVRFHIDDALAAESKLQIDSRLLSLALSVRRREGP